MTENKKLRALLAEARGRVGFCECVDEACESAGDFARRIDAALAEPQDSAAEVVESEPVEWGTIRTETYLHDTDHFLTVDARFPERDFRWTVNGCLPGMRTMQELAEGYCATEDEAKAAAIRAARGMQ